MKGGLTCIYHQCNENSNTCKKKHHLCESTTTIFNKFKSSLEIYKEKIFTGDIYSIMNQVRVKTNKNNPEIQKIKFFINYIISEINEILNPTNENTKDYILYYMQHFPITLKFFLILTASYNAYIIDKTNNKSTEGVYDYLYNYYLIGVKQELFEQMNLPLGKEIDLEMLNDIITKYDIEKIRNSQIISSRLKLRNIENKSKSKPKGNLSLFINRELDQPS